MGEIVIGLDWSGIDKRFKVYSITIAEVYFFRIGLFVASTFLGFK
jgi:hypothetical protein